MYNCCLSNINESKKLFIHRDNIGNNSLNPGNKGIGETTVVQSKKLDDFGFTNVDYIKIDLQMHELEVLEGAQETLKKIIQSCV